MAKATQSPTRNAWHRRALAAIASPFGARRGRKQTPPTVIQPVTKYTDLTAHRPKPKQGPARSLSGKLLADCDPLPPWESIVQPGPKPDPERRAERIAAERHGVFIPIPPVARPARKPVSRPAARSPIPTGGKARDMRRRNRRKEFVDSFASYSIGQADGCWEEFDCLGRVTSACIEETHEPGSHIEVAVR